MAKSSSDDQRVANLSRRKYIVSRYSQPTMSNVFFNIINTTNSESRVKINSKKLPTYIDGTKHARVKQVDPAN